MYICIIYMYICISMKVYLRPSVYRLCVQLLPGLQRLSWATDAGSTPVGPTVPNQLTLIL